MLKLMHAKVQGHIFTHEKGFKQTEQTIGTVRSYNIESHLKVQGRNFTPEQGLESLNRLLTPDETARAKHVLRVFNETVSMYTLPKF